MKKSSFIFSNPKISHLEFFPGSGDLQNQIDGLDFSTSMSQHYNSDVKKAIVALCLNIGKKDNSAPFFLTLTIEACFESKDEACTETAFKKLLDINAPALLMSYARPIVTLITSQAGFPALQLPFFDFTREHSSA